MGQDDAGNLLQVVEEDDIVPIFEQSGEGIALAVAELEGEEAAGGEGCVRLGDQAGVDVEAVGAGEEGGGGLVVADLGVEGGAVGLGDVGWVGDDGVEGRLVGVGDGAEEVGLEEADAVGDGVGGGVLAGDGERGGGDVEGGDLRVWAVDGEGDGDGAGAGADVGDAERLLGRQAFAGRLRRGARSRGAGSGRPG